jgi:Spy/CpxP family protein refolding chaperone
MKIRRPLTIVFTGILMVMIASPAIAQTGHHMGAGQAMSAKGPRNMGMGEQLTPQQQQTLQNIQAAHRDTFVGLHKKLWAKGIQLEAALTEDKIDQAKVNSLVSEINKLHSSLFEEHVKMQVEIAKAGLAYYTMRGGHMMGGGMMGRGMGPGMMGTGMMGSCPMMDAGAQGEVIIPE